MNETRTSESTQHLSMTYSYEYWLNLDSKLYQSRLQPQCQHKNRRIKAKKKWHKRKCVSVHVALKKLNKTHVLYPTKECARFTRIFYRLIKIKFLFNYGWNFYLAVTVFLVNYGWNFYLSSNHDISVTFTSRTSRFLLF